MKPRLLALGLCALLAHLPSSAATPESAATRLRDFVSGVPELGPAFGVAVVTPDRVLLRHVAGEARAGGRRADPGTPFYIASQTKSYVGLLAAILDAKGVLDLDDTLAQHWPDVAFPASVDPARWTLRDLLTHQVPMENGYLTFVSAYITELDHREFPAVIAAHSRERAPGFGYDNLGYNLYAAILEHKTGKDWKHWLASEVLAPLRMTRTSANTSDFARDEIAWNHIWLGDAQGWQALPPKPDAIMQSAGGMVSSVDDLATWLQVQLRGEGPRGSGIGADVIAASLTSAVDTDPDEPSDHGLPCHGYALGWRLCRFDGHLLYLHGGSYTGSRSLIAFAPTLEVGIAVVSNSDNMTGWLTGQTVRQFFEYLLDDDDAERHAIERHRGYAERVARREAALETHLQAGHVNPQWAGWTWRPSRDELADYLGDYTSDDPRMAARIVRQGDTLALRIHARQETLTPAKRDLFGSRPHPAVRHEPLAFERDAAGKIVGFDWQKRRFTRRVQ